jgi:hypothetical protein
MFSTFVKHVVRLFHGWPWEEDFFEKYLRNFQDPPSFAEWATQLASSEKLIQCTINSFHIAEIVSIVFIIMKHIKSSYHLNDRTTSHLLIY